MIALEYTRLDGRTFLYIYKDNDSEDSFYCVLDDKEVWRPWGIQRKYLPDRMRGIGSKFMLSTTVDVELHSAHVIRVLEALEIALNDIGGSNLLEGDTEHIRELRDTLIREYT